MGKMHQITWVVSVHYKVVILKVKLVWAYKRKIVKMLVIRGVSMVVKRTLNIVEKVSQVKNKYHLKINNSVGALNNSIVALNNSLAAPNNSVVALNNSVVALALNNKVEIVVQVNQVDQVKVRRICCQTKPIVYSARSMPI
uniref:Uncharacterized protein n=1 Tax=Cacopsylla melanoneura TaxID=428564 RepID=A0A8D8YN60_9HEMI